MAIGESSPPTSPPAGWTGDLLVEVEPNENIDRPFLRVAGHVRGAYTKLEILADGAPFASQKLEPGPDGQTRYDLAFSAIRIRQEHGVAPHLTVQALAADDEAVAVWDGVLELPAVWGAIEGLPETTPIDTRTVVVSGWALTGGKPIEQVGIYVNGDLYGMANTRLPKPAIGERFPGVRHAPRCGFALAVELTNLAGRTVHLEARAHLGPKRRVTIDERELEYGDLTRGAGIINPPVEARAARSRLEVACWVHKDEDGGPTAFLAEVDGTEVTRQELPAAKGQRVEWRFELDLRRHTGDDATLEVFVLDRLGYWRLIGHRQISFDDGAAIDAWSSWVRQVESTPRTATPVNGWALCQSSAVSSVEAFLDGETIGTARMGSPRSAIAGQRGLLEAPICGFDIVVDFSSIPADRSSATLEFVATTLTGRTQVIDNQTIAIEPTEALDPADIERAEVLKGRCGRTARGPRTLDRPPTVLAITHNLGYGGGQYYISEIFRQLVPAGELEVSVVSPVDGPLRDDLEAIGVPVHVAQLPIDTVDGYEGGIAGLRAWADPQGFDAVVANTLGSMHAADLADRMGLPCIWAIHESFDLPVFWHVAFADEPHPYVRERHRAAMASTTAAIFEADQTRLMFEPYLSEGAGLFLPWGVDQPKLQGFVESFDRGAARRSMEIADDEVVVLCLGTVEPRKAQARLAHAFSLIAAKHRKAHLFIVGDQENSYSEGMHELISRSRAEGRITVVPLVPEDETFQWYAMADVFICGSDVESMPRVIMEAMTFGVPVGATAIFGVPSLITDGQNGFLCEPNDLVELRDMLDRTLSLTSDELRRVAEAGRETAQLRCDSRSYVADWKQLIDALVADPSVAPKSLGLGQR